MMRITQQMLTQNVTNQMNRNLTRLERANEEVSTGKRINKPSDDPMGTEKSLKLSSELANNVQFERNADYAQSWLEVTEQSLSSVSDLLQRANEIGLQGANGINSPDELKNLGKEIDQLRDELENLANTKLDGKYIFNGQKTDQPIVIEESGNIINDDQPLNQRLSPFSSMTINVHAGEVFGGEDNLFKSLDDLSATLKSGNESGLQDAIGRIEKGSDQVLNKWTSLGAKQSRVESLSQRLKEENVSLQKLVSKNEDVDIAEAIMKLKSEESVYQASLASSAKIIQPSLMDFLR
ncbi:flagellar hook-associated protein FlgL [Alkalihalobacillus sp. R86527]|uniref:flagellar hook-associated protein FlgL n=1 Tax=Alkalihalobacillus sp. R86527 TaxID=3093863 RepID=UPI0036730F1F